MSGCFDTLSAASAALGGRRVHLAIGMFDGVHLGHRAVIESAIQSALLRPSGFAGQARQASAVLTFWPHPSEVLHPGAPTRLITDLSTKRRLILGLGADALITQHFDAEFALIKAEEFVPYLRERLPNLVAIYVGENWRFGQGRCGDIGFLVAEGRKHGLTIFSAPRVNLDGEPISSTRIRTALEAGEIAGVNAMLGYTYFSEGRVTPGKGLGRTIGFPTLNVAWTPPVRPRYGVYAVTVRRSDSQAVGRSGGVGSARPDGLTARRPDGLRGIANYGVRPTVERATEPRLEVHVFGECPFGAGDDICVEWERFIRPEMKFGGVDELKAQIARDIAGG